VKETIVPDQGRARRIFLLVLLFSFLFLAALLLRPFWGTLVLAVVLTSVFYPSHRRVVRQCKGRENLAAFLTATVLVLMVVIPLLGFMLAMAQQGVESLTRISAWVQEGNLNSLLSGEKAGALRDMLDRYLAFAGLDMGNVQQALAEASGKLGRVILSRATQLLGGATGLIIRCFLLILLIFYLLRDGTKILERLQGLSPLAREQEDRLIQHVRALSRSVVLGSMGTAAAQGLVGGIGLWLCGVPALFWGTVMAFTSLIPTVGTALVWIPAVGYLLAAGSWKKALFLGAWSVLLVGSIDNFLRPVLMRGQSGVSSIYLFFAILGGIHLFGIAGILYGPLIFGITAVLIYLYEIEFSRNAPDGELGETPT
jgi:predicted PurR-regulated permease PerM